MCNHNKLRITRDKDCMVTFIYENGKVTEQETIFGHYKYYYVFCEECNQSWYDDKAPVEIRRLVNEATKHIP